MQGVPDQRRCRLVWGPLHLPAAEVQAFLLEEVEVFSGEDKMKLGKDRKERVVEASTFSGRVKVTLVAVDQHFHLMSKSYGGLSAKIVVVEDTTLDEVFDVVYKALQEKCEEESSK